MDALTVNWLCLTLVVLLWCFTAGTFITAFRHLGVLKRGNVNGDMIAFMRQSVRHEAFRLAKHTMIILLILTSLTLVTNDWWGSNRMTVRNCGVASIGIMIGLNSAMDTRDRRKRWRAFVAGRKEM